MTTAKIFLVLLIGVVLFFIWKVFFKKKETVSIDSDDSNIKQEIIKQEIILPPVSEKGDEVDTGHTMVSLNSGWSRPEKKNGKGKPFEAYYMTYINEGGVSLIEEITKRLYDKFLSDFPSGQTKGNVLMSYK